ncbi:MAG: aminotransferase [candidate division NC10 bacterium RIFCSPLOWO2_02_FULL_66_22]|nr:MAG: aminotransferase [candidate division NC10 bacterium RIFCSPLOWO2_02_FULL_66_22]
MGDYLAKRVAGFGTSVFTEMSRLAVQHGAVNLGQGFPDFAGPDFVKEAAIQAIRADLNQYAVSHGTPRLRRAIAETWQRAYGRAVDPETEVSVGSGATEVLLDAILALVNPGDEVILFEPFYDSYLPDVLMAGGIPRFITLQPPDWHFDRQALADLFTTRTRLILINTPHNPTGKMFSRAELSFIGSLCQQHDALALTDEVYEQIRFDGVEHVPIATLPGMWERTLTVNSTGKTFSMTGWKIGYAVGPPALNQAVRATHQFVTFATSTPFQEAMATAMETAVRTGYYDQLRRKYTARRDLLAGALKAAGLTTLPVQGSYFLLADVQAMGFADDVSFCRYLTAEIGVAAIPPSAFYADPARAPLLARFCFAKRDETLRAAAERLQRLKVSRKA